MQRVAAVSAVSAAAAAIEAEQCRGEEEADRQTDSQPGKQVGRQAGREASFKQQKQQPYESCRLLSLHFGSSTMAGPLPPFCAV